MVKTIFSYADSENKGDLLDGALSITRFLAEVSPSFMEGPQSVGLSEAGTSGLHLILCGLENTIEAVVDQLNN